MGVTTFVGSRSVVYLRKLGNGRNKEGALVANRSKNGDGTPWEEGGRDGVPSQKLEKAGGLAGCRKPVDAVAFSSAHRRIRTRDSPALHRLSYLRNTGCSTTELGTRRREQKLPSNNRNSRLRCQGPPPHLDKSPQKWLIQSCSLQEVGRWAN